MEVSGLTDEISIDELIAATRHCKYGKAAGPDGIATDVIKDCSTILVWPLYYILISVSLTECVHLYGYVVTCCRYIREMIL